LENSQIRTELENQVRQIIRESGGVDNVNLETLFERIRGNNTLKGWGPHPVIIYAFSLPRHFATCAGS
jgi:hypothetical protein